MLPEEMMFSIGHVLRVFSKYFVHQQFLKHKLDSWSIKREWYATLITFPIVAYWILVLLSEQHSNPPMARKN